jgi:hypothetical protein
VLRRKFGLKRDVVTKGWRKLHNEELRNFNSSPSIIRIIKSKMIKWVGHVTQTGKKKKKKKKNVYKLLVRNPERKIPL